MTLRGLIQRPWQVAAFLAGRRTQVRVPAVCTRDLIKMGQRIPSPSSGRLVCRDGAAWDDVTPPRAKPIARCPLGKPGDVLAVRETHHITASNLVIYRADYPANAIDRGLENIPAEGDVRWLSPAVMPLRLARLRYRVLDIRAHLVREISEGDAKAEGVAFYVSGHGPVSESELRVEHGLWSSGSYRLGFEAQWEADYGPGSWERDWCFAATVERTDGEVA